MRNRRSPNIQPDPIGRYIHAETAHRLMRLEASPKQLPTFLERSNPDRDSNMLCTRWDDEVAEWGHQSMRVPEVLHMLNNLATMKDGATAKHILRMGYISGALGRAYGLPVAMVELLTQSAPLHDIGKIAVPDAILKKPGPLTDDEMKVMRTHTQAGFDLLSLSTSPVLRLGAEIALGHHERWDGTGYPRAVKGDRIPLSARLVAVADVLDALVHERPYKKAWPMEVAIAEIKRSSGSHFDPDVVGVLDDCLPAIVEICANFADIQD